MRENEECARNRWAYGRVIVELLESWTRSSSIRAGLAQRARIVLLAADGVSNTEIADRVGVSRPTVIGWRDRYASSGVRGLEDERRSGRPRTLDRAKILAATLTPPTTSSMTKIAHVIKVSQRHMATRPRGGSGLRMGWRTRPRR